MYFLIDFENVMGSGMHGVEYLLPSDHLILFYSAAVSEMEARYLDAIEQSGCEFQVYKLLKSHNNALDFYIATKVGKLLGAGVNEKIVIVSKDKGFAAVKEYGNSYVDLSRPIISADNIEQGIRSANENSERCRLIHARLKRMDIGNFFVAYEEKRKTRKILEAAFADTAFGNRVEEIAGLLQSGQTPKVIYQDALHRFGRKDGLEVYRTLKECAGF